MKAFRDSLDESMRFVPLLLCLLVGIALFTSAVDHQKTQRAEDLAAAFGALREQQSYCATVLKDSLFATAFEPWHKHWLSRGTTVDVPAGALARADCKEVVEHLKTTTPRVHLAPL